MRVQIPNGSMILVETDFNCPVCTKLHTEKDYYSKMKIHFVYIKCTGCKTKLGVTFDYLGNVRVWEKSEEPKRKRL